MRYFNFCLFPFHFKELARILKILVIVKFGTVPLKKIPVMLKVMILLE
jgi:hypothetical protein